MHEVSIAESVIKTVNATLEGREFIKVNEVHLDIGELTFISDEALGYAFKVLTERTHLEGAVLVITPVEGEVSCSSCGYEGPVQRVDDERWHTQAPILSCPECSGVVDITKGTDIITTNVKLEVNE